MKFTVNELLKAGSHDWTAKHGLDVNPIALRNLEDLVRKLNALGYTPPMRATSCLRSYEMQKQINPSAMGSSHLYGCAVDISDADGKLKAWCVANKAKLVECGLWMEDPASTKTWCHLQSYAPRSMNRIFKP